MAVSSARFTQGERLAERLYLTTAGAMLQVGFNLLDELPSVLFSMRKTPPQASKLPSLQKICQDIQRVVLVRPGCVAIGVPTATPPAEFA